jgi:hypothetical protein
MARVVTKIKTAAMVSIMGNSPLQVEHIVDVRRHDAQNIRRSCQVVASHSGSKIDTVAANMDASPKLTDKVMVQWPIIQSQPVVKDRNLRLRPSIFINRNVQ